VHFGKRSSWRRPHNAAMLGSWAFTLGLKAARCHIGSMERYSAALDGANGFVVLSTGPTGVPRIIGKFSTEREARSIADNLNERAASKARERASGADQSDRPL
jgi:hypothetical protein